MLRTFSASSAATWQVSSKIQGLAWPQLSCYVASWLLLGFLFIHKISWWATSLFQWAQLAYVLDRACKVQIFHNTFIFKLQHFYRMGASSYLQVSNGGELWYTLLCYAASFFKLCEVWLRAALGSFERT